MLWFSGSWTPAVCRTVCNFLTLSETHVQYIGDNRCLCMEECAWKERHQQVLHVKGRVRDNLTIVITSMKFLMHQQVRALRHSWEPMSKEMERWNRGPILYGSRSGLLDVGGSPGLLTQPISATEASSTGTPGLPAWKRHLQRSVRMGTQVCQAGRPLRPKSNWEP